MKDLQSIINAIYSRFVMRDALGFWIPGLVLLIAVRPLFHTVLGIDPDEIFPKDGYVRIACLVGLPYGAGIFLQFPLNLAERFWLWWWDSSLKGLYEKEKRFFETEKEDSICFQIRERAVFLKLMASKLALALVVLVWQRSTCLSMLLVAVGIGIHWELYSRYFQYTET